MVFVRVHALSCLVVGLLCLLVGLLIGYGAVVDGGWGQALAAVALVAMAVCLFAGAVALKRRYGWFG